MRTTDGRRSLGADPEASSRGELSRRSPWSQTGAGASAKGGGGQIEPTKRGKGAKVMPIVDRHGLPLAVTTDAANLHEVTPVKLTFDFYLIEAIPENLIGDRAYDSDPLDQPLVPTAWGRSRRTSPAASDARPETEGDCVATSVAGSSSAALHGFSGNVGSWIAGKIARPASSVSCSLHPSASRQDSLETGLEMTAAGPACFIPCGPIQAPRSSSGQSAWRKIACRMAARSAGSAQVPCRIRPGFQSSSTPPASGAAFPTKLDTTRSPRTNASG
jgi:hypothetical protein